MSCFQHRREVFKNWNFDFPVREAKKVSIYMNHSFILVICVGEEEEKGGGHSKSTFARNFQFLTPLPLVRPCSFYIVPHFTPPPRRTFALVSYPPSQKKLRNVNEFSNEKPWIKKREKNYFFCKLNIKDQCFLKLYIQ